MSHGGRAGLLGFVAALAMAVTAQAASAATVKADYRFEDTLASSVSGAPDITDIGSGNTIEGGLIGCTPSAARGFPQGNGLRLDTSSLVAPNDYSIAVLFQLADVSGFRRLIDFHDGTSDDGLYVHDGRLDFRAGGDHEAATPAIAANEYAEVVLANSPTADDVYVNGQRQLTTPNAGILTAGSVRLFKDNTSGGNTGEESGGQVARVRLYDGTLSETNALQLNSQSPLEATCATTAAKPAARRGPKHTIVVRTGVDVTCPMTIGTSHCAGSAAVDTSRPKLPKRLGQTSLIVPAGEILEPTVRLTKRGAKALRRHRRLDVATSAALGGGGDSFAEATASGRIKFPKKGH